jgi:hypothetical protein
MLFNSRKNTIFVPRKIHIPTWFMDLLLRKCVKYCPGSRDQFKTNSL